MGQYVQNPDGTHSQQTLITGSLPKKAISLGVFFNAVAITDTATKQSPAVDVTGYSRKIIGYTNTLNQPVSLTIYGTSADGTTKAISGALSLGAGSGSFIGAFYGTPSTVPGLQEPLTGLYLIVSCAIAPTSGSLTVRIGMEA